MTDTAPPADISPRPRLTLTPYVDTYLSERRKRGELTLGSVLNQETALRGLAKSFGARPIEQFGPRAVQRWQETIGGLSPGTRRLRLSTVRSFGRYLVGRKILKRDPTFGIPRIPQPRKATRALPADDSAAVLAACPDTRARAIVLLMLECGLRCGEVANLHIADYDHKAKTLFVVGKGGHERVLPVPADAARAIDNYLTEVGAVQGPLIRSQTRPNRGVLAKSIGTLVVGWMAEAGIKARPFDGVSAHAARHTAASDVLDRCLDIRVVQQMLGHSKLSSTAIYLRGVAMGELRTAMEGRSYRGFSTVGQRAPYPDLELAVTPDCRPSRNSLLLPSRNSLVRREGSSRWRLLPARCGGGGVGVVRR